MKPTKPSFVGVRPSVLRTRNGDDLSPNENQPTTRRILRSVNEPPTKEPTKAELNYQSTLDRQRLVWRSKPLRIELPTLIEKQRDPSLYKPLKRRSFHKRNPHQEWTVYDQCMANRNKRG